MAAQTDRYGPLLVEGDMFELMLDGYDAVGIPTNGMVNKWGGAVMGAGVANIAAKRWDPWLQEHLGAAISRWGNRVHVFRNDDDEHPKPGHIFSFPTKHFPRDRCSDIALIHRSAGQLMEVVRERRWKKVLIPQPGTGPGRLAWSNVWRVIAPIFDERVHIATLTVSGVSPPPS